MPEADLHRLLAGLGAAVAGEEDWPTEWRGVERWLGAQSSLFSIVTPHGPPRYLSFPSIAPRDVERYVAHYRHLDPYENIGPSGTDTRVMCGTEVIATADYLETEFYRDFVRTLPEPALHFVGAARTVPGSGQIRLGFQRRSGAAEFGPDEADRLQALLPFLVGLMLGWDAIAALADRLSDRGALADQAADAVLLLDRDGRVRQMNRAAERLAARFRLLARDGGGRPVLDVSRLPAGFTVALRQVAAGGPGRMLINRDDAGPVLALTLCILPASRPLGPRHPPVPSVLLRLRDLRER
ncbi:MAG: PAS domain-containing protein, partial [Gluconacetobacter diazotrophicus]|nr:PAS domain-containing protein [Gluconacetobacter diazotrophicus]